MTTQKSIVLHPFSDLSRTRPLFFICNLIKYSISGESRNFEGLRPLIIEALPSAPPPGPFTFLMECLHVLYFLYEARCCEVLWHFLGSVVSSLDELSRTFADDSKARKLAAKLFRATVHISDVHRINEGILVKLMTVFKIEKNDLQKAAYTGDLHSQNSEILNKKLQVFLTKLEALRGRDGDVLEERKSSLRKLVGKGWWHVAETVADISPELVDFLVILALEMGNAEKAAGICTRCCATLFCHKSILGTFVHFHEIRNLELQEFVSEENVIWVDTKDGLAEAKRHFAEVEVVGIDSEWIPDDLTRKWSKKVSILQIATEEKIFIFDMIKLSRTDREALGDCLQPLFHSSKIWKLGYFLSNDMKQLHRSCAFFSFCEATLDLQRFYGTFHGGLSYLTEKLLNGRIDKSLQMSDWGQRPLSRTQLQYAALDAIVVIAMFIVTRNTLGTDLCKSKLKCWRHFYR